MITVNNAVKFSNKKQPNDMELKGLSTDVKPTEVNGNEVGVNSIFLELDTNDFYYFDGEEWQKVVIEGGGSGEYDRDIAEIRNELKKRVYYFDNVASMKSSNDLKSGEYVVTKGYYEKNDGGGASYLIRAKTEEDVDDGGSVHFVGNSLVAELIIKNNIINFKQFGAKSQDTNNNLYDNKNYLLSFVTFCNLHKEKYKLYVPSGIYGFSETNITSDKGFEIIGNYSFPAWQWSETIFVPFTDNQDYIIKCGNVENKLRSIICDRITFSTAYYVYDNSLNIFKVQTTNGIITSSNLKTIANCCLDLLNTVYSNFKTIDFRYVKGKLINISSSWEIDIGKINIRNVWNIDGILINFDENNSEISNANISALNIDKIYAEAVTGIIINISTGCSLVNSKIGLINIEPNKVEFFGDINTNLTDNFDEAYVNVPIINIEKNCILSDFNINNIQLNNMAWVVTKYNNINYIYDTVIKYDRGIYINPLINNISIVGQRKDVNALLYDSNENTPYQSININNIIGNDTNYKIILNVKKIYNIIINNIKSSLKVDRENSEFYTACYKMNYVSSRLIGNITYDEDSLLKEKLCVNFIDKVNNPSINSIEIMGKLKKSNELYIRCKAPANKSGSLVMTILSDGTTVGTVSTPIICDDTFHWLKLDYSNLSLDFTNNIEFKIYPGQTVDFEMLADVMYLS